MSRAKRTLLLLKTAMHFKGFVLGVAILLVFIGLSVYAAVTWPFEEAIRIWNSPAYWEDYPKFASPAWISLFTGRKEIEGSIILDSTMVNPDNCDIYVNETHNIANCGWLYKEAKVVQRAGRSLLTVNINFTLNYDYDVMPSAGDYRLIVNTRDRVFYYLSVVKPNGLELLIDRGQTITNFRGALIAPPEGISPIQRRYIELINATYGVQLDPAKIARIDPVILIFVDDDLFVKRYVETNGSVLEIKPLKGTYVFKFYRVETVDINATIDLKIVFHGTVYGVAGTDKQGRDLFMAIAWGTPIAIAFGLTASVVTSLLTMIIAAISAWYAGALDNFIQRVNEIFMIIPFLPTVIMIYLFYGLTLWTLLLVIIPLSVLGGGGLKTMRAMFFQIKEMGYIEAARAYGASNARIIFRYMVPRVIPVLIPSIVTAIPSFVFLEAALAILGIVDPRLITWGKVLQEAYAAAALQGGYYHWILAPAISLFLLSIAFASIGFTLDKIFNPRLREL